MKIGIQGASDFRSADVILMTYIISVSSDWIFGAKIGRDPS